MKPLFVNAELNLGVFLHTNFVHRLIGIRSNIGAINFLKNWLLREFLPFLLLKDDLNQTVNSNLNIDFVNLRSRFVQKKKNKKFNLKFSYVHFIKLR